MLWNLINVWTNFFDFPIDVRVTKHSNRFVYNYLLNVSFFLFTISTLIALSM